MMERRPVTNLVEEIEGKEMQKETEVERLAGRRVEGRNNEEVGVLGEPLSIRRKKKVACRILNPERHELPEKMRDKSEEGKSRIILLFEILDGES